jgi:DNA-binding transcriptional ArsR family regulator
MATYSEFAEIASLAGDPARATMLHALMDGRALTATELADAASIAPQTASGHLGKLLTARLIDVQQQGRHRYYRLASPAVARMMESIMRVAWEGKPPSGPMTGPRDNSLRMARTCYDHLAGRLGVRLTEALQARGRVELADDAGVVTPSGTRFFHKLGIPAESLHVRGKRMLCCPCLDWSERRPHLGGALGAALCAHSLGEGWVRRVRGSRALTITPKGMRVFREQFGVRMD